MPTHLSMNHNHMIHISQIRGTINTNISYRCVCSPTLLCTRTSPSKISSRIITRSTLVVGCDNRFIVCLHKRVIPTKVRRGVLESLRSKHIIYQTQPTLSNDLNAKAYSITFVLRSGQDFFFKKMSLVSLVHRFMKVGWVCWVNIRVYTYIYKFKNGVVYD